MMLSRAESSKRSDYVTPTMKRISLRFRLELSEYHLCDSFFFAISISYHTNTWAYMYNKNYTIWLLKYDECLMRKVEDTKGVIRSEDVNRRRTDNKLAIRKMTKRQTTIYKTLHRKLEKYILMKT
jgi:hypothetical protein